MPGAAAAATADGDSDPRSSVADLSGLEAPEKKTERLEQLFTGGAAPFIATLLVLLFLGVGGFNLYYLLTHKNVWRQAHPGVQSVRK